MTVPNSAGAEVSQVEFSDHRCALERSASFEGLLSMYHLYTLEAGAFFSFCFSCFVCLTARRESRRAVPPLLTPWRRGVRRSWLKEARTRPLVTPSPITAELHKEVHLTTGHRLFRREFLCFNTVPCRHMPLLVHF